MDNTLRFTVINLAAALIIGASLIVSASIVAHKPEALGASASPAVEGKPKVIPPIAQDSVTSQFRQQVLDAPEVHTRKSNGQTYTLTDVKVKQVVYSTKDDTFMVIYNWVWNRPMPRPDTDVETMNFSAASYGVSKSLSV